MGKQQSLCIMPRLHLMHVAGYKLYSLVLPVSLVAVYMYHVSATKLSSRLHVSTCIRE